MKYSARMALQFFQLLSFEGGRQPDDFETHGSRFSSHSSNRSLDTKPEYTALLPFYCHLKKPLCGKKFLVMFPFW